MQLTKEARRKLRRRVRVDDLLPAGLLLLLVAAYYFRHSVGFPSEGSFYFLLATVVLCFNLIERRLKAMQLRLAEMHDRLDNLAGLEPENHVEAELTDE
ncbi:MAG TPA: hypothetical protein VIK79_15830 [Xanthobacteraceae bacterium]